MSISRIVPPLDYLKEASRASLQSFELARLNHAANLRREIGVLIDQWIKETSEAMLARWMLDQRNAPGESRLPGLDNFQTILQDIPEPLPESPTIAAEIVPAPRDSAIRAVRQEKGLPAKLNEADQPPPDNSQPHFMRSPRRISVLPLPIPQVTTPANRIFK